MNCIMTRFSKFATPRQKKLQLGKLSARILALMLIVPLFMASCTKNELEPVYADLAISTQTLDLSSEATATFTIENGSGEYDIKSKNEDLAVAQLEGNVVTVTTKQEAGEVNISVTDKKTKQRKKVTVKITVPIHDLVVETDITTLNVSEEKSFKIADGSGIYSIKSNEFISAHVIKDVITIKGVKVGKAKFVVTDVKTNQTQEFELMVTMKLVVKNKVTEIIEQETFKMLILSGSGNYDIQTNENLQATEANGIVIVRAIKAGAGKITVIDVETKQSVEFDITVKIKLPDLTVEDFKGDLIKIGDSIKYKVLTGTGKYEIEANDVVEAKLEGDIIAIKGLKEGLGLVNIFDQETEQFKQIEISVVPIHQQQITFTTEKKKGESLSIKLEADPEYQGAIWIDLNKNQKKDKGEGIVEFDKYQKYKIDSQDIIIYGRVEGFSTAYSKFSKLDVSDNQTLTKLFCTACNLTSLDISKNPNLIVLGCGYNEITTLDLSNNTKLEEIACRANKLSTLDLSKCINLKKLRAGANQLTNIDLSHNTKLESISINENQLISLDLSNLNYLEKVNCATNKITKLNLKGCISLVDLYCIQNELTEIDVTENLKLKEFSCYENKLTSLDISNNKGLTYLAIHTNQIKGQAMTDIVNALPSAQGGFSKFRVVHYKKSKRTNVCNEEQVKIASRRGWWVQDSYGKPYTGKE